MTDSDVMNNLRMFRASLDALNSLFTQLENAAMDEEDAEEIAAKSDAIIAAANELKRAKIAEAAQKAARAVVQKDDPTFTFQAFNTEMPRTAYNGLRSV